MVSEQNLITSLKNEMFEEAFKFWFSDHEHIRSPFPIYIRGDLQVRSLDDFLDWAENVPSDTGKDLNEEIVAEKFEEILFETAAGLVKTYDEKLTILYPFLPRLNDMIKENHFASGLTPESVVIDRTHVKRGDHAFMKIKCRSVIDNTEWETDFELPE